MLWSLQQQQLGLGGVCVLEVVGTADTQKQRWFSPEIVASKNYNSMIMLFFSKKGS
jgi:hypothetical protein